MPRTATAPHYQPASSRPALNTSDILSPECRA